MVAIKTAPCHLPAWTLPWASLQLFLKCYKLFTGSFLVKYILSGMYTTLSRRWQLISLLQVFSLHIIWASSMTPWVDKEGQYLEMKDLLNCKYFRKLATHFCVLSSSSLHQFRPSFHVDCQYPKCCAIQGNLRRICLGAGLGVSCQTQFRWTSPFPGDKHTSWFLGKLKLWLRLYKCLFQV